MSNSTVGNAAIAVVRRNTEEVQGKGNWDLFEELFADDFLDHTPQPGTTPDKDGVRVLYKRLGVANFSQTPSTERQVFVNELHRHCASPPQRRRAWSSQAARPPRRKCLGWSRAGTVSVSRARISAHNPKVAGSTQESVWISESRVRAVLGINADAALEACL